MIYFVRDTSSGLVKIGFSEKPWGRFSKIQADCPTELELACVVHGDRAREDELHCQFAHLRVRGEWFHQGAAISEFLLAAERVPFLARKPKRRARPASPLISYMAVHDLTDAGLAVLVGLSTAQMCRIRNGKSKPRLAAAMNLERVTGIPAWDFVTGVATAFAVKAAA